MAFLGDEREWSTGGGDDDDALAFRPIDSVIGALSLNGPSGSYPDTAMRHRQVSQSSLAYAGSLEDPSPASKARSRKSRRAREEELEREWDNRSTSEDEDEPMRARRTANQARAAAPPAMTHPLAAQSHVLSPPTIWGGAPAPSPTPAEARASQLSQVLSPPTAWGSEPLAPPPASIDPRLWAAPTASTSSAPTPSANNDWLGAPSHGGAVASSSGPSRGSRNPWETGYADAQPRTDPASIWSTAPTHANDAVLDWRRKSGLSAEPTPAVDWRDALDVKPVVYQPPEPAAPTKGLGAPKPSRFGGRPAPPPQPPLPVPSPPRARPPPARNSGWEDDRPGPSVIVPEPEWARESLQSSRSPARALSPPGPRQPPGRSIGWEDDRPGPAVHVAEPEWARESAQAYGRGAEPLRPREVAAPVQTRAKAPSPMPAPARPEWDEDDDEVFEPAPMPTAAAAPRVSAPSTAPSAEPSWRRTMGVPSHLPERPTQSLGASSVPQSERDLYIRRELQACYQQVRSELDELDGDEWARQIGTQIERLFGLLTASLDDRQKRKAAVSLVQDKLRRHRRLGEPDIQVQPFGSTLFGIDSPTSDVDLCIIDSSRPHGIATRAQAENMHSFVSMNVLARVLEKAGMREIKPIPNAGTPICKFVTPSGISCDINFNEQLGLRNSGLLRAYCDLMPDILRPMAVFIKYWARQRDLNDPSGSLGAISLSSYTIILMLIAFLQQAGQLPNLQAPELLAAVPKRDIFWMRVKQPREPDGSRPLRPLSIGIDTTYVRRPPNWPPPDHEQLDLATVAEGFFRFYGDYSFNYSTTMISIRDGGVAPRPGLDTHSSSAAEDTVGRGEDDDDDDEVVLTPRRTVIHGTPAYAQQPTNLTGAPTPAGAPMRAPSPTLWEDLNERVHWPHPLVVADPFQRNRNCALNMQPPMLDRLVVELRRAHTMLVDSASLDDICAPVVLEEGYVREPPVQYRALPPRGPPQRRQAQAPPQPAPPPTQQQPMRADWGEETAHIPPPLPPPPQARRNQKRGGRGRHREPASQSGFGAAPVNLYESPPQPQPQPQPYAQPSASSYGSPPPPQQQPRQFSPEAYEAGFGGYVEPRTVGSVLGNPVRWRRDA